MPIVPTTPGLPVYSTESAVRKLLLDVHGLWSPGIPPVDSLWGLPVLPCVQVGASKPVRELSSEMDAQETARVLARGGVWAWTKPGDMRAVQRYGSALIADVEVRAAGGGWRGVAAERDFATVLALQCHAVTSHGFVLRRAALALKVFAEHACIAIPQVYDADGSANPKTFVRTCVSMYRDHGFMDVVPLLGIAAGEAAGVKYLRRAADTCRDLGVNFHVWAYGSVLDSTPEIKVWVKELGQINLSAAAPPTPLPDTIPPRDGPAT